MGSSFPHSPIQNWISSWDVLGPPDPKGALVPPEEQGCGGEQVWEWDWSTPDLFCHPTGLQALQAEVGLKAGGSWCTWGRGWSVLRAPWSQVTPIHPQGWSTAGVERAASPGTVCFTMFTSPPGVRTADYRRWSCISSLHWTKGLWG